MLIINYVLHYESVTRYIDGNKTSNTINDLKRDTRYNITLRAFNLAEWGPSSSVEIKTLEYCKFSIQYLNILPHTIYLFHSFLSTLRLWRVNPKNYITNHLVHTRYATLSSGIPCNINISLVTSNFLRALCNYFIPCHGKYSGQHNQCDIPTVHIGKDGCNHFEYTKAFLYSDWL